MISLKPTIFFPGYLGRPRASVQEKLKEKGWCKTKPALPAKAKYGMSDVTWKYRGVIVRAAHEAAILRSVRNP